MATTGSSFTALPEDVLQRVLLGVSRDDHVATAAACRAFRAVIRGPRFLRLRREYGFAERRIIFVGQAPRRSDDNYNAPLTIHIAGYHGAVASIHDNLSLSLRGSSTDGGARLFVSTTGHLETSRPSLVLAVDGSTRRWSRLATLPLNQILHCLEWHGGLLYVAGGLDVIPYQPSSPINNLQAFDETTGLWQSLPQMPHACALAASGVIGNELFIAGGRGLDHGPMSTLQIYDFTTQTWRLGAPLPYGHCGAYGIVYDDGKLLYLVPSRVSTVQRTLVYDVQSNTWSEQEQYGDPPYEPGHNVMHAFAHKGRIVAARDSGWAYHRVAGTGSDWSRFDLDVEPGIINGVAGSVILG